MELPDGITLRDLPLLLSEEYGPEFAQLLSAQEPLDRARVLINGRDHFALQGLATVLLEGDTVTIMPPLVGGG